MGHLVLGFGLLLEFGLGDVVEGQELECTTSADNENVN
jgi:hypothetical protein